MSPVWEPDNKVVGCLPPGTGTVSLWASDRDTGEGTLAQAFTYDDPVVATTAAAAAADPDDTGEPAAADEPGDPADGGATGPGCP
jgi:hypothetical protein